MLLVMLSSALTQTCRYLHAEGRFETIDVFEQQASFGGVWNYSPAVGDAIIPIPQTDPNAQVDKLVQSPDEGSCGQSHARMTFLSPMYEGLETNIPHVLMQYPDAPILQDHQLFPSREAVVDYLVEYAKDVTSLVHFRTEVTDIQLMPGSLQDAWIVETRSLDSKAINRQKYDAVVVASGHYNVPKLPDLSGIQQWDKAYPGSIAHSMLYRTPVSYSGKKVVVVGNSASGVDIASQIANVAKLPVLNSTRSDSPLSFDATWKRTVPEIAEFVPPCNSHRAIRFTDGSVETEVDTVLFCTGYFYSYPFLSNLQSELIDTGERVQHLYYHLFHIEHPSLAFIGLPSKVIPFRTSEGQAAVVARVWANRLALPSEDQMKQWEAHEIADRGAGTSFHILKYPKDFEYHNSMVGWALQATTPGHGKVPLQWSEKETWQRERFPLIKKAFAERGGKRHDVTRIEELGFDYDTGCEK